MNNKNNNNYRKQTGNEQVKGSQKPNNYRENSRSYHSRDSNPRQRYGRDGYHRHGGYYNRQQNKVKAIETTDDIKADISRIEKEIKLEIKEIKSLRLGL